MSQEIAGEPRPARYTLLQAGRLIQQGKGVEAIPVLEELGQLAPGPEVTRLRYLAIARNSTGDFRRSLELLDRAELLAKTDGDDEDRVYIHSARASAYEKSGDHEAAMRSLRAALKGCEDGVVLDEVLHLGLVADLAAAHARRGEAAEAGAMFDQALAIADSYSDRTLRAKHYSDIAVRFRERGDVENATYYNQKAVHVSEEIRVLDRIAGLRETAAKFRAENGR